MIRLTEGVWIGASSCLVNVRAAGIGGVLNVAVDLNGEQGWPDVEYAQVGLVDGPGNETTDYCAALLALVALVRRHENILVYDHNGGRALAVGLMYLSLMESKRVVHPTFMGCRLGWGQVLDVVRIYTGMPLPSPHTAHAKAFEKIPFGLLEAFI